MSTDASKSDPITIKKYANRRLYNTAASSYVTLETLSGMVKEGVDFVVYDAKTGDDITRSVLAQIIFDEEAKGENLLPINFLRQLIRFYGDSLQGFLPAYLEMSLNSFAHNQEQVRSQMTRAFSPEKGIQAMQNLARQNMEWYQKTMSMFAPFSMMGGAGAAQPFAPPPAEKREASRTEIEDLRAQVEAMAAALAAIAKDKID
ncbi:polyhydroxyalkanoate synthesis repressor PhaR [Neomegalonema perideroedes]|uniref:polyhydroxyalkanoate synthesis repressor PhaR n=1 Tax=Neomegalonema perideroedes TaxID=217219 RepID=UPI00036BD87D|nr:polyhydroxyalkanoate synthesis repressor PhaR [Neomegalonema perideroedes]